MPVSNSRRQNFAMILPLIAHKRDAKNGQDTGSWAYAFMLYDRREEGDHLRSLTFLISTEVFSLFVILNRSQNCPLASRGSKQFRLGTAELMGYRRTRNNEITIFLRAVLPNTRFWWRSLALSNSILISISFSQTHVSDMIRMEFCCCGKMRISQVT